MFGLYYTSLGTLGIIGTLTNGNTALLLQGVMRDKLNTTILDYYKTNVAKVVSELSPQW